MDISTIIKESMLVAIKICFFQFVIVWLFPFIHPMLAWGYVVFCVVAYDLVVK